MIKIYENGKVKEEIEENKMVTKTEWICENGHEGVVEGGFAQKNAPEKCPICGASVEENEIEV